MPPYTGRVTDMGPVLQVSVAVSGAAEDALNAAGDPVPAPVRVTALIDTGTSHSVISPGIVQQLGLKPVGVVSISTPVNPSMPVPLYAVRFALPNPVVLNATAVELPGLDYGAVIGRDVLSVAVLVYIGHASEYTIAF